MTITTPSTGQRITAQAWFEFTSILRNGEQALLNMVIPTLILVVAANTSLMPLDLEGSDRITLAFAAALTVGVMSAAFTTVAIATGFDRRAGVLRYLGTTALRRSGLLAGKALAVGLLLIVQLTLLTGIAFFLGWNGPYSGLGGSVVPIVLATGAFAAWALFLAGTLRAEATLALANLIWLGLVMTAGVMLIDLDSSPAVQSIAQYLPSGALAAAVKSAMTSGALSGNSILVLAVWLIAGVAATTRWFKWD